MCHLLRNYCIKTHFLMLVRKRIGDIGCFIRAKEVRATVPPTPIKLKLKCVCACVCVFQYVIDWLHALGFESNVLWWSWIYRLCVAITVKLTGWHIHTICALRQLHFKKRGYRGKVCLLTELSESYAAQETMRDTEATKCTRVGVNRVFLLSVSVGKVGILVHFIIRLI